MARENWRALPRNAAGLTARQQDVFRLLASGALTKSISWRLDVNENTVKCHIAAVRRILGCSTRGSITRRWHFPPPGEVEPGERVLVVWKASGQPARVTWKPQMADRVTAVVRLPQEEEGNAEP